MKQQYINHKGNEELLLFFSGWGMDENPFLQYSPHEADLMVCYDYTNLEFDTGALEQHDRIRVMAWSMGVWAASVTLAGLRDLPEGQSLIGKIEECIAVNGTLSPIDDNRGIPPAIFRGTIEHLDERGIRKFNRRMCTSSDDFMAFMEHAPQRTADSLKSELEMLERNVLERNLLEKNVLERDTKKEKGVAGWHWNKAYIAEEDRIFPAANQMNAWNAVPAGTGDVSFKTGSVSIETIPEGHYCPILFAELFA